MVWRCEEESRIRWTHFGVISRRPIIAGEVNHDSHHRGRMRGLVKLNLVVEGNLIARVPVRTNLFMGCTSVGVCPKHLGHRSPNRIAMKAVIQCWALRWCATRSSRTASSPRRAPCWRPLLTRTETRADDSPAVRLHPMPFERSFVFNPSHRIWALHQLGTRCGPSGVSGIKRTAEVSPGELLYRGKSRGVLIRCLCH
jgi:hypothetical protein